jgi:hypothetical protein
MIGMCSVDKSAPVDSLDQLYAQACLLMPVLRAKALAWAGTCNGMMRAVTRADREKDDQDTCAACMCRCRREDVVHVRGSDRDEQRSITLPSSSTNAPYHSASKACDDTRQKDTISDQIVTQPNPICCGHDNVSSSCAGSDFVRCSGGLDCGGSVRPSKVKSARRCVDKADVAYKHDVSRLLDVYRETLYFDTVCDLHACLEEMRLDAEVEIVRVKSTMTGECDSDPHFAGLRCSMTFFLMYVRMSMLQAFEQRSMSFKFLIRRAKIDLFDNKFYLLVRDAL